MDTERIVEAMRSLGHDPAGIADLAEWSDIVVHPDVRDYLTSCVTEEGFDASGIGILGRLRLAEENAEGVSPGGQIRRYGFVAIAISVGGNAVVLSSNDGHVYWADYSSFSDSVEVSCEDRETGEWHYSAWAPESVQSALIQLSDSVERFLLELLAGRLQKRLDALD